MSRRVFTNRAVHQDAVPEPSTDAAGFHVALEAYAPTPLHDLPWLAAETRIAVAGLKDESGRLGLPAFKVLGASWAAERTLRERPDVRELVAASAGNHGRAVAHEAARRGLGARIFLPAVSSRPRRAAIEAEGAEVFVVDGSFEDALEQAHAAAEQPGVAEIGDVGTRGPACWVIDGYQTLFAETLAQGSFDLMLVPAGVGSLAAAATRFAAQVDMRVIGVEPSTAPCLTASFEAGCPTAVANTGTTMAGLDCAEISETAWPTLRDGMHGTITVDDDEVHDAMRDLATVGLPIGDCGAAPVAALRALATEQACAELRAAVGLDESTRALLIATEGPTDPDGYRAIIG